MAYGKIKADAIIYDNSGSDVEKTVVSLTTPEGTAVKSTGESGTTKFLRVDGDGTCSWQVPPTLTLVDEDNMSSNSASSVPSQQSVKAYVDTADALKANLTGATFTGDVTFDGETAGRDIVFDRSDDALEFADSAKAKFGDSAELQIYHVGSGNGYIKNSTGWMVTNSDQISLSTAANNYMGRFESASVGLYSGGTERIQANSTGAAVTGALTVSTNLTVSGDLTVSGTTTTINTATLDVEDKNIVLGKVSSPSDTTADGGGITLKGASDKEIKWINSTDRWTFNQNLEITTGSLVLGAADSASGHINAYEAMTFNIDTDNDDTNRTFKFCTNGVDGAGTTLLTINESGDGTFAGSVSDSKGNLRSIPLNGQNGAYTLVAADAGKAVDQQSGGWTVNNSVFSAGDAVTLINNSGSDMTITQGSGLTIYNTTDGTTGNRTLAGRGMATIYFVSASNCYISGSGLS